MLLSVRFVASVAKRYKKSARIFLRIFLILGICNLLPHLFICFVVQSEKHSFKSVIAQPAYFLPNFILETKPRYFVNTCINEIFYQMGKCLEYN